MAIPALDTTIGGAAANSYVALADAENYHDAKLNSSAWTNATADDKTRALLMAARRLESLNWIGARTATTQALAWPRIGVVKRDAAGADLGYGFVSHNWGWGYGEPYNSDEIPQQVKDAQCELALAYLDGFDDGEQDAIDSFSTDGVNVKFRSERPSGGLPAPVQQLIGGLIAGNRLMRG